LECRVQGAVVDEKLAVRLLLEKLRDSIGVVRLQLEASEDQYFKSSLKQFQSVVFR